MASSAPAASPRATARAGQAAIAAAGLTKCYGRTLALAGLDLDVAAGETVALLGPNGAGKSTAIGLLLGLLSPDRGQVQVYDRPPSQAVADGPVGAMLQDAGLMPGVRVGELLAMVRGLYPRPLPAAELVALADLESVLGRRVDRLSGGQAQRVRFAAAIAGDPQLLLLDEATSAMDVQARRNFWAQIHGFAARGRTVLFATYYLQEADDAADRVIVVADGRIVWRRLCPGMPGHTMNIVWPSIMSSRGRVGCLLLVMTALVSGGAWIGLFSVTWPGLVPRMRPAGRRADLAAV